MAVLSPRLSPPCPSCGMPTVTTEVTSTGAIQAAVGGYYPLYRHEDFCRTCYHRWNRRVVPGSFISTLPPRRRPSIFARLRKGFTNLMLGSGR